MFHSRRRAASNPASKAPPSASASLAATKAFIRDRESNASLSNAAAAAALRTHATTPTPVGDTVTKRMARKGSVSSQGSGSQQPGLLRRHSSSGSMTERSFRAPSPARNSPVDPAAPPVPAVPKDVSGAGSVHRRTSSLEPPFRGASPAARGGGRGVSLDRGVAAYPTTPGRGQPRVSSLSKVPEDEHDGSPRSINFSRPISPQQTTSPPQPVASQKGGHSGWFGGPVVNTEVAFRGSKPRPKTSDGLSGFDMQRSQQTVQNAADRPVSTKKTQMSQGVEGARLAAGSMRAKPSGSAVQTRQHQAPPAAHPQRPRTVDPKSPYAVYDPSTRTFIHKQDAMALHRAISDAEEPAPPYEAHPVSSQRYQDAPQQKGPVHEPVQTRHVAHRPPSPPQEPDSQDQYEEEEAVAAPERGAREEITEERPPTPPVSRSPTDLALARRTSEDFADADIRPSIDANTSRKLESTVPGRADAEPGNLQSPKLAPNQDNPYPRLGLPSDSTATRAVSPQRQASIRSERTQSLSPPRNAHFAAVAVEFPNGVKHQPPPRSVSPAKSALKSSPSVSRRSNSPIANDGRMLSRGAVSEASDAMSDDGNKKKKKNVRVSFDEDPVVAGTSAYAEVETPTSPTGLSASRWNTANEEQHLDDYMKPRPMLPSFGSIRDKDRRSRESDVPEKVTETVSSSLSASATSASEPLEGSSDHAIGGILAHDFATKKEIESKLQEPLPPEVTSVEGSGYISDSDQSEVSVSEPVIASLEKSEPAPEPTRSTLEPEPKTLTTPAETRAQAPDVPVIAVQPASPSPTEKPEPKYHRPFVPGGWDEDELSDIEPEEKPSPQPVAQPAPITTANINALTSQPSDNESTDDNSSIYSDAYEDLSETEDGGFGSIDAVVESPIAGTSGLMSSKYADTGVTEQSKSSLRNEYVEYPSEERPAEPSDDWDAARNHWSEMNGSRRQQQEPETIIEQPAPEPFVPRMEPTSVAPELAAAPNRKTEGDSVTKTPKLKQPLPPAQAATKPRKSALKKATHAPQAVVPAEPQLRKTMRSSTASEIAPSSQPRMRKSMRNTASMEITPSRESHMRKTMRPATSASIPSGPSGLAASRHSMPPLETKPPKGALQKKHIPAAAAASTASRPRPQSAAGPIITKPAGPAPTYDSDSDASASSFQRQRPRGSQKDGGRYTMRASMRSGPTPTMRQTPAVRPISPPQATSPPPTLKKSMRPTTPSAERPTSPGLRSSRFSIRSLSPAGRFRPRSSIETAPPLPTQTSSPKRTSAKMPTFGKSPKSKAPPAETPKARFKSRFADSSDEDEDERPRRFQSRFADSDDEEDLELPSGLTPVRGIPRKPGEEDRDSTDLEDEASDTEPLPTTGTKDTEKDKTTVTNGTTNGQGVSFAAGSLRESKHATGLPVMEAGKKSKAKRSFFGLGKKKAPASYLAEAEANSQTAASTDIPMPPGYKDANRNRPLTPIGEDKDIEAAEPAPRSPKLQRRPNTPQWGRSTSDSWPLPQPPKIGQDERPQSSDGIVNRRSSLRPTLSKRNSSQISEARTAVDPKTGKEVIVGRTGKKKKFQGLRRVFGLND